MILGGAGFCPSTVCLSYTNQVIESDLFVNLCPLVGRHLTLFQGSRFHHHQKGHNRRIARKKMDIWCIGHQEHCQDFLDQNHHEELKTWHLESIRYPKLNLDGWYWHPGWVVAMSWIMSDGGFGPAIIWTTKSKKKTWSPLTILGWNRATASHRFNVQLHPIFAIDCQIIGIHVSSEARLKIPTVCFLG